ncbi:hypothetical protein GCM10010964_10550 [Caldovatus sediminis]|uniref:Uncharacterized protein n=1 Tax=Caldovatus sediminis TaxID=2041189 RepID=A0A8J3EBK5_9PROT|nr:hypothetical protein [Caldovatus sediminis]GGG24342.1 hypothetical protein GCM10010964_10550 [Caldovatus sediminis]
MLRRLSALSILTAACLLLMAMAGAERAEAFIAGSGDALAVSVCSALFWYAVALRRGA